MNSDQSIICVLQMSVHQIHSIRWACRILGFSERINALFKESTLFKNNLPNSVGKRKYALLECKRCYIVKYRNNFKIILERLFWLSFLFYSVFIRKKCWICENFRLSLFRDLHSLWYPECSLLFLNRCFSVSSFRLFVTSNCEEKFFIFLSQIFTNK